MKIIIAGGRNYIPKKSHLQKIIKIIDEICVFDNHIVIISGGCDGADLFGELIGRVFTNYVPMIFTAKWEKYGKSAGPKRNEEMAKYAVPYGGCILLPGGNGTANMKMYAEKYGLKIWEIK